MPCTEATITKQKASDLAESARRGSMSVGTAEMIWFWRYAMEVALGIMEESVAKDITGRARRGRSKTYRDVSKKGGARRGGEVLVD